jgi:hypothetical protein
MSKESIPFIEEIYEQTALLGLCDTQEQFSVRICGKSPKWFSSVKSTKASPSVSSLVNITAVLNTIAANERSRNTKRLILGIHDRVAAKLQDKIVQYEF